MKKRYLLIEDAEVYRHEGKIYLDHLWKRDLERHLDYLSEIHLGSPIIDAPPPSDKYLPVHPELQKRLVLINIPIYYRATRKRMAELPIKILEDIGILCHVRKADLLHVCLNEHPLFYGFLFPVLKWFTSTRTLVIVEATSHWRRMNATGWRKWDMKLHEFTAKLAVKYATAAAFTSQEYRDTLAPAEGLYRVIPATWMDEESIVTEEQFKLDVAEKVKNFPQKIRVGFFARLIVDKGADLLLQAAKIAKESGVPLVIDIWGEGAERENLTRQAQELGVEANFCGMLRYGPQFFDALRQYHFLVVPNRLDEQPRIIFDTFSQGVPVIASDTPGNTFCVRDGVNGVLFPKNNPAKLAEALIAIHQGKVDFVSLADCARKTASSRTHRSMHKARADLLAEILPPIKTLK
ncbi:MAG: glycosyltransferase family 4 protein [Fibrobacteres bacterium]|nr:glycosyltransferase family 4 protein [Fibrobacterota bacterium]